MRWRYVQAVLALLLLGAPLARAQQQAPASAQADDAGALAKQLANPVASLISVPLQFS